MKPIRKITSLLLSVALIAGIMVIMPISASAAETTRNSTSTNPNEIVSISAGNERSSAVRADGSLWTWGLDYRGLSVGQTSPYVPCMVMSQASKSCVSGNNDYCSAVLKDDNSLWMWGSNSFGSLGIGSSSRSLSLPCKVLEDVVAYDTSGKHSAAITSDGSLYLWGYNYAGQIGNGTNSDTGDRIIYSPVKIMSDVVSVSLGVNHSAAIKKDGSLWTWGQNDCGQLGDGTFTDSSTRINIMNNVADVALGGSFTIILKKDGTVYSCGDNTYGQLGKGSTGDFSNVPKLVELEGIVDVEAGYTHAAALASNGDLRFWGANGCGQIGNGSTSTQPDPTIIMRNVRQVSLGESYSMALKNDNTLWSWGANRRGQLGYRKYSAYKIVNGIECNLKPQEFKLEEKSVSFQTNEEKTLNVTWDDNYFNYDASVYNKDLAVDGLILSEAAYSNQNPIYQFGFEMVKNGMGNDAVDKPGYLIGHKVMYDFGEPRIEIVMAIRGTKNIFSVDALTDIKSVSDGFEGATQFCYDAMKSARSIIASELGSRGLSMTKKNTKYFIVGHSLGGACAGKLALKMGNDGVGYPQNIYTYTYAAPNYTNLQSQLDTVIDVPGIFNIVHGTDIVPTVPKVMQYNFFFTIPLYKAGKTYTMNENSNISSFNSAIYDLYGEIPWDLHMTLKAHMTPVYLALIQSCTASNAVNYSTTGYRILSVHCPVDVEVYNSAGELCAKTSGEKVTYTNDSAVRIEVVGDEKFVELPDNDYSIKYIGTDEGTMKIEDQVINAESGEVVTEKTFNNIALAENKKFESNISSEDTEKTDLFVIDKEDDKIASVNEDGFETVFAKYDITDYDIEIGEKDFKYDGTEKTQEISVDERLTEGTDYRIIYDNNKNVGTATVTVKGVNEYSGRVSKTFNIYDNGKIGDSISWEINPAGVLTLSGEGSIPDYDSDNKAPWSENSASIKKILIENGITTIGNNSFIGCENLSDLYIPTSVTQIGDNATDGCTGLSGIHYEGTEEQWNEVTVGENNAKITENEIIYNSEMHLHNLKKVEAKEATYTEDGNSEYWVCEDCDKYFSDSEGENEIEKDSWIIPKLTEPTEPLTEKPTDKPTEAPSTEATEPTQSFTDETEATSAEPVITEPTQLATEATEPATVPSEPATDKTEPTTEQEEPTTNSTEPTTNPSEPVTNNSEPTEPATPEPITEPVATKEYKFLPNSDLESRGCSYKLLVQDNNGNLQTFSFTAANIYLDGVKLYMAKVPESISPTMLIYQFFEGDTWVGQVTKTYNELTTVSGNIVKADGTIYGEETPTEKPSESTEQTADNPTEPVTTEPTQAITTEPIEPVTIEPTQPVTAKPTEPVVTKPQPTTPAPTTPVVKPSSKLKPNPIKVTIKKKTVKLKKLKKKAQTVKAVTIKSAKGKVSCKITKAAKIKKYLKINAKGVITFKAWKKAKKGTYKIKVKITVKGNSKYKPKTIKRTVKISLN